MIERDLTPEEIESVLQKQCYAHLGFVNAESVVNVLPITYVYDKQKLYSFSLEGEKIEAMRCNPDVCVQIEELQPPDSWHSVQVWGKYAELEKGSWDVVEKLIDSFWSTTDANNVLYTPLRDFKENTKYNTIVYEIAIERSIGKLGTHAQRSV